MTSDRVTLTAVPDLPLIEPGDDLASLIDAGLRRAGLALADDDVLVVAQKVVSKAEGRSLDLATVTPGERARELATVTGKDPRLVEAILSESQEVLRAHPGVLIVVHRLGFVMANAGIDRSNVEGGDRDHVLLLPKDPDGSAAALKTRLDESFGARIGVVINDSFGRPWRMGVVGVALGAAGIPALRGMAGELDLFGRPLEATEVAIADEIAAAGSLLMGQAAEGQPVVHIRGLRIAIATRTAGALIRPRGEDLFR